MLLAELFRACAYTIEYKQAGDSVNYAFVEKGSNLEIYFQGSNSISDWVRNFLFAKKPYKDMDIPYRVHRGFLAAWKEVEDIIIEKINTKVLRDPTKEEYDAGGEKVKDYKYKHITIIGYSHGGALAGFCHECVWFHRPDLRQSGLEGYGFEAPRFFAGFRVKKQLKERWATFKVIRNGNDIVTHCPPWIFGFCHIGDILHIKGNTEHIKQRIPKCVKYHYPQVVLDGLMKYEGGK